MTGTMTCRLAREDDMPALLRLWREGTDWGALTPRQWREWYVETPYGEAPIVVAVDEDTGEIEGQLVFSPSLVCVDGREVSACRPCAPLLTREARGSLAGFLVNPLRHPVVVLYTHGVEVLRARGCGLLYMVPDPDWVRLLRLFPSVQCGAFPLWSRPVPRDAPLPLGQGYAARPLAGWGERVDGLWRRAARLHGCQVVRDSRYLRWRTGAFEVLGVERGGELMGLVASQAKGDGQWLVCELLAADAGPSLRATLAAVANLARERALAAPPDRPVRKVAVLTTAVLEPAARELGFARDDYDFPVAVQVLDPALPREAVDPARWYVSATD
jgi:hypothetical protein